MGINSGNNLNVLDAQSKVCVLKIDDSITTELLDVSRAFYRKWKLSNGLLLILKMMK